MAFEEDAVQNGYDKAHESTFLPRPRMLTTFPAYGVFAHHGRQRRPA